MTDLVSLFRNFIYRDLAFILGGAIVLLSAFYALRSCALASLHSLPNKPYDQPYILFLFTVLAYVVGYTIQDFGAVLASAEQMALARQAVKDAKLANWIALWALVIAAISLIVAAFKH